MRFRRLLWVALTVALVASAQEPSRPRAYAVRDARIVTVSGPVIEIGTIVLEDGLISAVGADVEPPPGAWVIDGAGLTVYPGLIDGLSAQAQPKSKPSSGPTVLSRGPEDRPATTPWVVAADTFNPKDDAVTKWREAGVLALASSPGEGMFPGHVSLVDLSGDRVEDSVVEPRAGLLVQIPDDAKGYRGYPGALLGRIAYVKQVFLDADYSRRANALYHENPRGLERPRYDRALEPVVEAVAAGRSVLYPANTAVEIRRAADLAPQLDAKLVVYGGQQAYEAADALKQAGLSVLVNADWPEPPKDPDPEADVPLRTLRFRDKAKGSPAALEKAGVRFGFYSGGESDPKEFLAAVREAVQAGLSKQAAIRALTLGPAEIYGVDDRLGSLQEGKIANLILVKGDLFEEKATVKTVFVDGRKHEVKP